MVSIYYWIGRVVWRGFVWFFFSARATVDVVRFPANFGFEILVSMQGIAVGRCIECIVESGRRVRSPRLFNWYHLC